MGACETEVVGSDPGTEVLCYLERLRNVPQGCGVTDSQGLLVGSNPAWHRTLGLPGDNCIGRDIATMLWTCDEDFEVDDALGRLQAGVCEVLEFDARPSAPGDPDRVIRVAICACDGTPVGTRYLWQIYDHSVHEYFKARALQLEQVLEQSGDSIIVKDLDAVVTFWNREASNVYGFSPEEAVGRSLRDLHAADLTESQYEQLLARIRSGKASSSVAERRRKNGAPVWVALKTTPLTDHHGKLTGEITVARDVTEIRHAEEALRNVHATLEARLTAIREANRSLSREISSRRKTEETLRTTNGALQTTVQRLESFHRDGEALSRMAELLQSCGQRDEAYIVIRETGENLFPGMSGSLFIYRESRDALEQVARWGQRPAYEGLLVPDDCWALRLGRAHYVHAGCLVRCRHVIADQPYYVCLPVQGQGQVLGLLHLEVNLEPGLDKDSRDQVERRMRALVDRVGPALANLKLRDSLRSLSLRDALTGLYNRRYVDDALQREMHRAGRAGKPLSLIMLDIDHFKRFNDTFGHDAGDHVLGAVAQLLPKNLRTSDLACRYGGEELAVVMPEAGIACALDRAEILRKSIRSMNLRHRDQNLPAPTASFGVAEFPAHGNSPAELMKSADRALYRAKHLGRDQVCVAEDLAEIASQD